MHHPSLRRRLLAGAALLLAPVVVLATPGTAEAATGTRVEAAGGWLGRQLDKDSHVVEGQFGPDYGVTADVVLALDAAGVGRNVARRATRALKRNVLGYTGGGQPSEFYAGSFAKLLVLAAARGTDPTTFGGSTRRDLVSQLLALECGPRRACAPADRGRFSDRSEFGDFSGTIGQSLALIGLERATDRGPSPAAVRFLLGQQCADGSFPVAFGGATCDGDVDATGFAVQALVVEGSKASADAAADAGRWLARRQKGNGSFVGTGARNANSTALAAQAFDALERNKRAREARTFIRSLQRRCGADSADRGAIRYDRAGGGDTLRATAQSVPALARVTLAELERDGSRRALPRLRCSA